MCNIAGEVIWIGDDDMVGEVDKMGKNDMNISLPDISKVLDFQRQGNSLQLYRKILNVDLKCGIYGLEFLHVHEVVHFVQTSTYASKKQLILMTEDSGIINFPITKAQVMKYYVQIRERIKGNLRHRNSNLFKKDKEQILENAFDTEDEVEVNEDNFNKPEIPHSRELQENRRIFAF